MAGTLDRVATSIATQLMQATARTADGVSEGLTNSGSALLATPRGLRRKMPS
jgi:hypothetical protein